MVQYIPKEALKTKFLLMDNFVQNNFKKLTNALREVRNEGKKIHHVAIICSGYEKLGCDIVKETYRSDRQSYKLDLMVGGEI